MAEYVCYRQDRFDQAETILREGIRIKCDHPDLLNNLARVMMEKGALQNALYPVEKAIFPGNREEYRDTRQAILKKMEAQSPRIKRRRGLFISLDFPAVISY